MMMLHNDAGSAVRRERTAWRPLLSDDLARRVGETVDEIARVLIELPLAEPNTASLIAGDAGIALFQSYHARAAHDDASEASGRRRLDQAVDALVTERMRPDLYHGFTGIAWVVEHTLGTCGSGVTSADDPNDAIDEALEAALRQSGAEASWARSFEFLFGLVGVGVYALERLGRPRATGILELIVSRLGTLCERAPDGIAWFTPPDQLAPKTRTLAPDGYYNVGVAHGSPGVIAFLGQVYAAGIAERESRELLEGSVSWLLARRSSENVDAFPAWITPQGNVRTKPVSWCYGNPGIAAALLVAARAVGERSWEDEALHMALACAGRSGPEFRAEEACLCHGSAGNGHLFNRLFQATSETRFRDAAVSWFAHALELRRPGSGLAGFESKDHREDKLFWVGRPGFLNGISGIGLALLAATTTVEPSWDRLLLAELSPQG